jgi:hypothetical protein
MMNHALVSIVGMKLWVDGMMIARRLSNMAKPRKGYIRVSTGGLTRWVKAASITAAFNKFLKLFQPKKGDYPELDLTKRCRLWLWLILSVAVIAPIWNSISEAICRSQPTISIRDDGLWALPNFKGQRFDILDIDVGPLLELHGLIHGSKLLFRKIHAGFQKPQVSQGSTYTNYYKGKGPSFNVQPLPFQAKFLILQGVICLGVGMYLFQRSLDKLKFFLGIFGVILIAYGVLCVASLALGGFYYETK